MLTLTDARPAIGPARASRPPAPGKRVGGPVRQPATLTPEGMLALQESAGNTAVARLLRQPATEAPAGPTTLRAARFADNDRLQRAARNSPPLRLNELDDAVARIQRAFLDLGYPMPKSTKSGHPDAHYGRETMAAVRRFQEEHGVPNPSGHEAGTKTLAKLDEVFVKRDAAIEPPPAVKEVALQTTRPAVETPDKTVTKPEAKVTLTSVAPAAAAEHEHRGQIELSGSLDGEIHLGKKPPEKPPDFLCDHLKVQLDLKGNINLVKLGDRVTLFPSVSIGAGLAPKDCGKAPGVEAHLDLLKAKLTETAEIALMTSFQPTKITDIGLTGWIGKSGFSFEVKPSKTSPFSLVLDGAAGVQRIPIGSTGHFFWFLEGGVSAKVEFGFF